MDPFDKLTQNLDNQLMSYNQLLSLETEKMDALRKNDIEKLKSLTEQETKLLDLLSSFEGERLNLVNAMGFSGMTMSQILPYVNTPDNRYHMDKIFNDLTQALNKIQDTNQTNQNMASLRLHDTEFILKSLAPPPAPVLYKSDGSVADTKEKPKHIFKNERI